MSKQIINYIYNFFPLISYFSAVILAQVAKPFFNYPRLKKIDMSLVFSSGGYPSSHSAGVAALALAVGLREFFSSSLFAVITAIACIVIYDAANVRFHAGLNIQITKKLISDLKEKNLIDEGAEIYERKIKEVLGHTWKEIWLGIIFGFALTLFEAYILLFLL